jgi:hypothetical protein
LPEPDRREARYRSALAETLWRRNLWKAVAARMAFANAALVAWIHGVDVREKTMVTPPDTAPTVQPGCADALEETLRSETFGITAPPPFRLAPRGPGECAG